MRRRGIGRIGDRGSSVIDYVVTNVKAIEEVKKVVEGMRTESDHLLLEVEIEKTEEIGRKTTIKDWMEVERLIGQKKELKNITENTKTGHVGR